MKKLVLILSFLSTYVASFGQSANWTDGSKTDFPINISYQPEGSGRFTQLKFHPGNPNKYYAITPEGGLFISEDAGDHWMVAPGTDALTASCASICIDRTNDQILYLGTGDPNLSKNGSGVYKSTDGGLTFMPTSLTNTLVVEILQHPTNPNVLVAATNKGAYKSTDNGNTWTLTTDASVVLIDMKQNTAPNSSILYASTIQSTPATIQEAPKFYRSTDFGSSWTQITSGIVAPTSIFQSGSRVAVTPADSNVVYFSAICGGGMVYKSTDSGLNFTLQKAQGAPYLTFYVNSPSMAGLGNYSHAICVDATDPGKIWFQSQNTWFSTDSGVSWTMLVSYTGIIPTNHHYLVQSPYDAQKLYNCNDGSIWLSVDGGLTWTPKSNGLYAYEITSNTGKSSHTDKDLVSIGTKGNGRLYRNADAWYNTSGGDDLEVREFDYLPNGGYFYNLNHNTRTKLPNTNSATYGIPTATVQALGFNRTNPELGFMGNREIYRCTDLSVTTPTWTQISNIDKDIFAIHSCIADPNKLYVITSGSLLYVSNNALSATPNFTTYPLPTATDATATFTVICNNANTVYFTMNNEVFRSENSGQTWTNITYNLPNVKHRKILAEEYGGTEELVFIATNNAVYYKKAGDVTWTNYSTKLPARRGPMDFSMFDDGTNRAKIRYATYGRGIWETGFDNLRTAKAAFTADHNSNLCLTNGVVNFTDLSTGGPSAWSWTFPGGIPSSSTEQNPSVTYTTPGTYDVTLTISTPSGNFTATQTNYISGSASIAGGTYNVGPGGDFTSITAAVNYWNSNCIDGAIVFNLTGTSYTNASGEIFPITINPNNPGSSLLIKPVGNASITGSSATALIVLNGVDRVTIDGSKDSTPNTICPYSTASRNLTITNTFNSTTNAVVWLQSNGSDGATNNTVKNCIVIGNANTRTLIGIGSGSSTVSTSSFGIGNHHNSIINNSIQKCQYGIYSGGQSTINKNTGTVINQNALNSSGENSVLRTGILVKFEDNIQISGNTIGNMNPANNSNFTGAHGIACSRESSTSINDLYNFNGAEVSGATITDNIIDNIEEGASKGSAFGIYLGAVNSTAGNSVSVIANNFVTRINGPAVGDGYYVAGIACGNGLKSDTRIYNNTVHLTGTASDDIQSYGIVIGATQNSTITHLKNNIITNQVISNNRNYVLRINFEKPYLRFFSDYNNFYASGGYFISTAFGDLNTLAAWKTLTGTDANSKNVLPEYTSATDLHLTTSGANNIAHIFGYATPLASVSDDIDCDARDAANPTIGADENCAAPTVPTLSATATTICPGSSTTLKVTTGKLNSATEWKWYSGACGNTLVGTGTSIMVSPATTTTYYVRGEGRCVSTGNCASMTITVNTSPLITGPAAVCTGSNVTLDAGASFFNYSWSNAGGSNQTATYNDLSMTTTYTVTVTGTMGCTATATTTVVVHALPTVSCPANSQVCINTPPIALNGSSPAGGNYSGAGVNAGFFNPATAGVGVHTINYSYTDGNGCANDCSATITVNPLPVVTCAANATVCISAAAIALNGSDPAGGTYSGNGVNAGMFDPAIAGVGAHTVSYSYTDVNGCANDCSTTITVNPLPVVTCATNAAVCVSAAAILLNGGSPAGGTYSGAGVNAGMFDPAVAGVGAHSVSYSYSDANGCANDCSATITVNPLPVVTCPANAAVCVSAAAIALNGSDPAGGTYSGTGVNAGVFDPAIAGVGAHSVTYSYTDANGCANDCNSAITVNPLPVVTCAANAAVCVSAPAIALNGSSPAGGTYSGTGVNAGVFDPAIAGIGVHAVSYSYSDANGCANDCSYTITVNALPVVACATNSAVCVSTPAISLTDGDPVGGAYSGAGVNAGMFDPAAAGIGVHTVTYSYADANGCANDCSYTITVNALPAVNCPGSASVNINEPAYSLSGGSPSGGTFSGSGVGAGIFDPLAAGLGMHTITYSFSDANGCENSCSFNITVNMLPTVTCAGNLAVCINAPAFALTEGSPAGGTYSGTGISAGLFDPGGAGTGVHMITYTNGGSCSFSITVNALPTLTCPANASVSINTQAFALSGSLPAGGTYSGTGVNAGIFDPVLAGAGTQTITYTFADLNNCTNSCTYMITVDSLSAIQDLQTRKFMMQVSPNPTSGLSRIQVSVSEAIETRLTVINALGQILMLYKWHLSAGENLFELNLQSMPAGIYQVRIASDDRSSVVKVLKQQD